MGKGKGAEGRIHRCCPQENDVTRRSQKDCCRSESSLGKVAEAAEVGVIATEPWGVRGATLALLTIPAYNRAIEADNYASN